MRITTLPKLDYEKTGSLESRFSAMSINFIILLIHVRTCKSVRLRATLYISGYHGDYCDFINCDNFDEFCILGTCYEYHNNVTECECDDGVTGDNCEILKHCDLDCGDNGTCDSIFNQGKAF